MSNKKRKRCESCNQLKHYVEKVIDPYNFEIGRQEVQLWLCPDCYEESIRAC